MKQKLFRKMWTHTSWSQIDVQNKKTLFGGHLLCSMSPFMRMNSQLNIPRILLSPTVQGCIQKLFLQPESNHQNRYYTNLTFYCLSLFRISQDSSSVYITSFNTYHLPIQALFATHHNLPDLNTFVIWCKKHKSWHVSVYIFFLFSNNFLSLMCFRLML
jgi:hypothetical protein